MRLSAPTDDDLLAKAREHGWKFGKRRKPGGSFWTWIDPDRPDDAQPMYTDRGHALNWMRDRIERERIFEV